MKILHRQKRINLTIPVLQRLILWSHALGREPNYRWIATDTRIVGILFDEIRRINHDTYLKNKGQKQGIKKPHYVKAD